MSLRPLLVLIFLGLAGCGSATDPPDAGSFDAGPRTDATASADSAAPDAAVRDSGSDTGPESMPCTATGACDPFVSDGCPAGQKCRVVGDMGTVCQDLTMTPALGAGATCTRDTDCDVGLWCTSFDTAGVFECTPICPAGSVGSCGADAACSGRVGMEACVRVCRPIPLRCNIFTQDCGDPTQACTLATNPETNERYTGCRPAGTLGLGEVCGGGAGSCAAGSICIRNGDTTACHQVCGPDGGAPTCTATGENCIGFATSWMIPYCA